MAENNFAQLMAQWQAAMPQADPGKTMPIFLGARGEINVGNGLSLKAAAPANADATPVKAPQARPGLIAALLKQMGIDRNEIMEGMKKVAQAGAVQPASQADLFGQGGPSGGSFVSAVGSATTSVDTSDIGR